MCSGCWSIDMSNFWYLKLNLMEQSRYSPHCFCCTKVNFLLVKSAEVQLMLALQNVLVASNGHGREAACLAIQISITLIETKPSSHLCQWLLNWTQPTQVWQRCQAHKACKRVRMELLGCYIWAVNCMQRSDHCAQGNMETMAKEQKRKAAMVFSLCGPSFTKPTAQVRVSQAQATEVLVPAVGWHMAVWT